MKATMGLLTVAIGEAYVRFWENLAKSFLEVGGDTSTITWHVFSDTPELVRDISETIPQIDVQVHNVSPMGWPQATLLRYEIFEGFEDAIDEEILVYLDADMAFASPLPRSLCASVERAGIILVKHPGYFRPRKIGKLARLYMRNPAVLFRDLVVLLKEGGLGQWETRQSSTAYVPRRKRNVYVCGGIWMGRRDLLTSLIRELAGRTRIDMASGIVARWHDESHLNAAQARARYETLGPEWCYVSGWPNLEGLVPIVEAIDKGDHSFHS